MPSQLGDKVPLCPPPVDLLSPEILTAIQEKAEIVATELKLAGLASIRGYVNTDTGSLTVLDVNTVPDLTTGSLIFKQVSTSFTEATRHYLCETLAFQSTRLARAMMMVLTQFCTAPSLAESLG